jgi:ribonucleoside-diphosphate reductase alpha chain
MFGIGNDYTITSLSNCFVVGSNNNADSYGSIMRTDEEQIQIMKRRGGVGHDLSHLRPSGSLANNSALNGMAGSVLYAQRYSNSTKEVRQGDRRGALMLSMSIKHPDAEKFIDSKLESSAITDANISLKISDEFMRAVEEDADFIQMFPIDSDIFVPDIFKNEMKYDDLVSLYPPDGSKMIYLKKVKAKRLWNKIVSNAWKSAEPGVLFWDTIIKESPADCYESFKSQSVNPCAELVLCEYDSCRLLLINLFSFVVDAFTPDARFDMVNFGLIVQKAQRLMDDIVDLEVEKILKILSKIESDEESEDIKSVERNLWNAILKKAEEGRRTGLGVTAEGDMLAALGLRYGSKEASDQAILVHKTLAMFSYRESIIMAKERGCFPSCDILLEDKNPFINRVLSEIESVDSQIYDDYLRYGRRNISNLTISPAGSVSILTQTTSGVEPCFSVTYKRRRRTIDKSKAIVTDDNGEMFEEYNVFHHKFIEWYDKNWYKLDSRFFDIDFKKPLEDYSQEELSSIISKSPYHKATANDVDWVSKVKMQGDIQKWVDHSISATTNIPKDTSVDIVDQIYRTAYYSGCKGMTIYREGSRSGILVSGNESSFSYMDASKRPEHLICDIYHKTALKKNWMILVGKLNDKPYEIFAFQELPNHIFPIKLSIGKVSKIKRGIYRLSGVDETGKSYEIPNIISLIDKENQVTTRQFSIMLRHHIDPKFIIEDIEKYAIIGSFEKVVQRVLRNYTDNSGHKCPECEGKLKMENGCFVCMNCGWSKCS